MTDQTLSVSVVPPVAPSPGEVVVGCKGLTTRYGELTAVDEVAFALTAGTVTGYLGPDGGVELTGGAAS